VTKEISVAPEAPVSETRPLSLRLAALRNWFWDAAERSLQPAWCRLQSDLCEEAAEALIELEKAVELAGILVTEMPCQQMMTIEDCDVAVATHVRHPDRYERVPRSEWCNRCAAADILSRAALNDALEGEGRRD
jgi:hypothetical protein